MNTLQTSSTICAIATSAGGAIGVVRVSGPDAIAATDSIFRGRKLLSQVAPYSIVYGEIYDSETVLDQVLVSVFKAPHSYTGEDSVEISCHGSQYILNRLLELLVSQGCEMASPGEYTMRAFANGKLDLSQAEAVADLIAADSKASHQLAINQLRGGISKRLASLRNQLVELSSLLELELDFSEEDVEFADREKLSNLSKTIQTELFTLISSFSAGNAIKNGIPVAIIGAPNVGKSTLLNALLQEDRAIVSDIQGTTRDVIEDTITLGGTLFRFIDTAGIRQTDDKIEQLGIERSLQTISRAQIILLITEPGIPYPKIETRPDQTIIHILNKSEDFQAINGKGLPWLEQELMKAIPPTDNSTVLVTNQRHKQALERAHETISLVIGSINTHVTADLIAEDLRQCIYHLSEIVGDVTSADILSSIFSKFCVGK